MKIKEDHWKTFEKFHPDDISYREVFVLLADGDGTMRSQDEPLGIAVDTEEEAKRFVKEGKVGYTHSYCKVRVFVDKDKAIKWRYKDVKY